MRKDTDIRVSESIFASWNSDTVRIDELKRLEMDYREAGQDLAGIVFLE